MKFLCIACDEQMKLIETKPPDRGSLTLIYKCPKCDQQTAMLTNPYETQIVGSLGVDIGPEEKAATGGDGDGMAKCPFADTLQEMGLGADATGGSADHGASATGDSPGAMTWTAEAKERLLNVPEFARPMALQGIEKFARDRGSTEIDQTMMDEAKEFFGM